MSENYKSLENFVGLYPVSKTLRFELKPVGKTLENMEKNGIILSDKVRDERYKKMKKTLDEYHRCFIEDALQHVKLSKLDEYYQLYCSSPEVRKSDDFKKSFKEIAAELRKEIADCFRKGENERIFKIIDKKELIKDELESWLKEKNKDCDFYPEFKTFNTYFTSYHTNRANMYTDEEKSTAIAYRLINENLPKFIDNLQIFKMIYNTEIKNNFKELTDNFKNLINARSIEDIFTLNYFNNTLTQTKIELYNSLIGGYTKEDGTKIKGLNEYINLYNQKNNKKDKLPKLKQLYKQILSADSRVSFIPEKFDSIQELLEKTRDFFEVNLCNNETVDNLRSINILNEIKTLLHEIKDYDLNRIYLRNDSSLKKISQSLFGDYAFLEDAVSAYYDEVVNPNYKIQYEKAKNKENKQKEKEKFTKQDYISIKVLQDAVNIYIKSFEQNDDNTSLFKYYSNTCISDYFTTHFYSENISKNGHEYDLVSAITAKYSAVKGLLNTDFTEKELQQNQKDNLKIFLDSILELLWFVKPLYLKNDIEYEKDEAFYSAYTPLFEELNKFTKLYDKIRAFITKKPYSLEKFKLNFDNPVLAEGWDVNKEPDYSCILLIKNEEYYVAVLKDRKAFKDIECKKDLLASQNEDSYSKVVYKQISNAAKYISGKQILPQNPPEKIKRILEKKKQDSKSLSREEIINFISYCQKDFLINYNCLNDANGIPYFDFRFKSPDSYSSLNEFFKDVENQAYRISFIKIKSSYVDELVSQDKIYLFQIYNKDFSKYSKGTPNLHTMYWKALFDEKNLRNVIYKLNGQAEIFYREKSIKYPEEKLKTGHHYENLKDKFKYPIIKDRRYAFDKFMLHVPITLNFKSNGKENIDNEVREFLRGNPDVNIIGIDRGERHLLYLSLIDQKANVLIDSEGKPIQYSLNEITNKYMKENSVIAKTVSYHEKLDIREKEREKARENWNTIESIKELKEGYLSQVVHLIVNLMVKYNAILVMEDLNMGFKRGRFKVEKQIYQKFEKMLIDKLNYLVLKDRNFNECGGIYKALQLTSKFKSFREMGKQNGFIFYVPAWNTSKIDPATGFVDLLKPKHKSVNESAEFFSKFDRISYKKDKDYFEFEFDYNKFTEKAEGTKTRWTVCSFGNERYIFNKKLNNNVGGYEKCNVTQEMKDLFKNYGISYETGNNLKDLISNVTDTKFFSRLTKLLSTLLALRYSSKEDGRDFILSPVANEKGVFFNSETADISMPQDADANGAYHIAKKGLWILKQINKADNLNKINLAISNKEWLSFVQNKEY